MLEPGQCTVSSALCAGLQAEGNFVLYHHILSRAIGASLAVIEVRQVDPEGILAVVRELHGRMAPADLSRVFLWFAAVTTVPWSLARAKEHERVEAIWARIDNLEDLTMLVEEIIAQREQELAEARAEDRAAARVRALEEGRMESRMETLQGVASLYLDEATLKSCMADLQQRSLAALPQAFQVVEAAQQAEDPAAAVAALLRGTGPTRGRPRG